MSTHRIVTLPGDGIGPEIMAPDAASCWKRVGEFEFEEHLFGGASIDAHGDALTDEVLAACRAADAVLLAAVGGPKWDTTDPAKPRPEQGLLGLRKGLGLYANLRPVKPLPALYDASPLRRERIEGTDLLVVRELTGGIYFGEKTRTATTASDLCAYTTEEIERIARTAFGAARAKVTSVDKANVLETSRLWREVVSAAARARVPRTSSSSTCSSTTPRCSSSPAPRALRHDPHREHVRRHPLRRGRDAHRLDRDASERVARRGRTRAVRARARLRPGHRRARARPTRWRCSSRPR